MQKEFQDGCSIVGQHTFEIDDVPVGATPYLFRNGFLNPFFKNAPIPTVIEDEHLASIGHLQPETPEPRILLLVSARTPDRVDAKAARIWALRYCRDCFPFAGGVPPFKHDDGWVSVIPASLFEIVKALLQEGESKLVFFSREFLSRLMFSSTALSPGFTRYKQITLGAFARFFVLAATPHFQSFY